MVYHVVQINTFDYCNILQYTMYKSCINTSNTILHIDIIPSLILTNNIGWSHECKCLNIKNLNSSGGFLDIHPMLYVAMPHKMYPLRTELVVESTCVPSSPEITCTAVFACMCTKKWYITESGECL